MLKHLPDPFLKIILTLVNKSLELGKIPSDWKKSVITMLLKSGKKRNDPNSYRPISLLSCLGKLIEKIMNKRLVDFLEENNLIISQQSGFRARRGTKDNLIFITQKTAETIRLRSKRMLFFGFDIKAAFDCVWHDGLIYKLIKLGVPEYLILWFIDFLACRSFVVRVGESLSISCNLATSVPQGSPSAPTLFSIYINDIPARNVRNVAYSAIYADDLCAFFPFSKAKSIKKMVDEYLKSLEAWQTLWRMKMAPTKCTYTIFSKRSTNLEEDQKVLAPVMFGVPIPYEANPTTLGVTFDEKLNFTEQVKLIKGKCSKRLNLIRILSHKSWQLKTKTLVSLYRSLIGSIIEYSSFISSLISTTKEKTIQAIQNKAMRAIFKKPYSEKTENLCKVSGLPLVKDRLSELNHRYFEKAISNKNALIVPQIEQFLKTFSSQPDKVKVDNIFGQFLDLFKKSFKFPS